MKKEFKDLLDQRCGGVAQYTGGIVALSLTITLSACGGSSDTTPTEAARLSSVSPQQVIRAQTSQLQISGEHLPQTIGVEVTGGACGVPTAVTAVGLMLSCTFDRLGEQTLTLSNTRSKQIIGSVTVQVKSNVTAVAWMSDPIYWGDTVIYRVQGSNLTDGMGFKIEHCQDSPIEVGTGSQTQRQFQCTLDTDDHDSLNVIGGQVTDQPKGQVLFEFTVPVMVSTLKNLRTATGVSSCSTATASTLPCTAEALGELYGLGQDGEVQAGPKMSYSLISTTTDTCVMDHVTGLMWEQKTNDAGLHDQLWEFSWYESNSSANGGFAGYQDPRDYSPEMTSSMCGDVLAKCNTQAYVAAVNTSNYCGHRDWRLPTSRELLTVVDFDIDRNDLKINPIFKRFFQADSKVDWTSSPTAYANAYVWGVDFNDGVLGVRNKYQSNYIRLVRKDD